MENFHGKLTKLQDKTLEMGQFAAKMLEDSVIALKNQDQSLAADIYERRIQLQEYDFDIEEHTLKLLTLYQPMASDMRLIACILKMVTYINRIGRYGKDIAKITLYLGEKPHFKKLITIPHMAKIVVSMVNDALKAFKERDFAPLNDIEERDDAVDDINHSLFREVISYMMEDNKIITQGTYYIMASRYLERCGDHVCKMAEKIYYMITGERKEIK